MKIYTKSGDQGKTSSWSGGRVNKTSLEIEVIGTADEVISWLGVFKQEFNEFYSNDEELSGLITRLQNKLFNLCALCSGDEKKNQELNQEQVEETQFLEKMIDKYNAELPELKNFILPGSLELSAKIHFARSKVRTLERRMISMAEEKPYLSGLIPFLNRTSDLFFVLARLTDFRAKAGEFKVDYAKNPHGN